MITFQTVADVTADRRVVLALPPEVPTGKVEIAVAIAVVVVPPEQPLVTRAALASVVPASADSRHAEVSSGAALHETNPDIHTETGEHPLEPEDDEAPAPTEMEDVGAVLMESAHLAPVTPKSAPAPTLPLDGQAAKPPPAAPPSEGPPRPATPPTRTTAAPPVAAPSRTHTPPTGTRTRPIPATDLQLSTVLGSYRLTKKLGQGRLGPVYLAHQASLQRDVVVKVLSRELADDAELLARFLQDTQRMARLRHPNILPCFEIGEAQGYHFLAMDFIEEGSAGTWLKKLGKLPVGDGLQIILSCCEALQYAHELKVIHGDIKPDNVLLAKRTGVKIADTGLLRSHGGDLGLSRTAAGAESLFYLAPEQLRDSSKHADPRSDLYSLGCLLYVFLTGEVPFKGRTLAELIEAKERGTFRPARELNLEVPERLDRILQKLLAVRPEERYASCAALILDLGTLGLANKDLSFLRPPPAAPMPTPSQTPAPAPREWYTRDVEGIQGYWYVTLTGPDGKSTKVRKVTYRQLLALIKKKAVDAETPVSQTRHGTYRPLGSYTEFGNVGKGRSGKFSEHVDLASWMNQEAPKKSSREGSRWGNFSLPEGSKRWLVWGGAAVVLIVGWFVFTRTFLFWRLQNAIAHWFN